MGQLDNKIKGTTGQRDNRSKEQSARGAMGQWDHDTMGQWDKGPKEKWNN